jgi:HK97 gp10 family phage protein
MSLTSRFPQIAASLQPRVTAALREAADEVADEARGRVVVASGDLRDSIHVDQDGDDVYVVAGNDDVYYGHLVEFGSTPGGTPMPARPFLIPALEAKRDDIVRSVKTVLRTL